MTHSLEERVAAIESRNAKVATDKAWETSWMRRGSVALITYIVISLTLMLIGHDGAWVHSIIPVIGYLLSTLALPFIRNHWQKIALILLFAPSLAHADIPLALSGPFSGSVAAMGEEMKSGADAAIEEINAAGGVLGEKLVLQIHDDACSATQATIVANKIVAAPPAAVMGPLCSAATLAAAPIYAEAGLPQITFSSNPQITEKKYKNLFRLVGRDDKQAPDLVAYLIKNYPRETRFAVLDDKGSWGLTFADFIASTLKKHGYNVTLRDAIVPGQKDFSSLITRLKTEKIDAVVMGLYVGEAALLVRQSREQDFKSAFFGGDPIQTPEFVKIAGPAANGVKQSGLFDPRGTLPGDMLYQDLKAKNKTIGVYTFYAYTATHLLADSIAKAKSKQAEALTSALATNSFDSFLGPVSFDAKGDLKHFTYSIFEWKDGEVLPVR